VVLSAAESCPIVARGAGSGTRVVRVGDVAIGGPEVVLIAGPCAVESEPQLEAAALAAKEAGCRILRGGAYKPRTSPYSFQGLGAEGLALLRSVSARLGLLVVTEVLDTADVDRVAEHADMLQVGSRNMHNAALLKIVGRQARGRPVLLKRGMCATIDEWLLAAEYLASEGCHDVVLCERGVRSFDPSTRNLLDLSAVPLLRERTRLPVVVDPSHGTGRRSLVAPMALAAVAAGADGVMVECHASPREARSDGEQALSPIELLALGSRIRRVAAAVGRAREATDGSGR